MTIALKNSAVIVKSGRLAESCNCCCVGPDGIVSVSVEITASDWLYQNTLTSQCPTRYNVAYFSGASATGTHSLTKDANNNWGLVIDGIECWIAVRFVPNVANLGFFADLELLAGSKRESNSLTLKTASDLACGAAPSVTSTLSGASVLSQSRILCTPLAAMSLSYSLTIPSSGLSSDCSPITSTTTQTGSRVVSVVLTPQY
jgi:hypothetical protein